MRNVSREVLVACVDCETPYVGFYDEDGELRTEGGPGCHKCEGSNLREITADEVHGDSGGREPM